MKIAKQLLTGIFRKNHELGEVDDEVFLEIIRSGIEVAAKNDKGLYNELFDHTIKNYVDAWLDAAAEDEDEFDVDQERKEAKATFMKYFDSK
ncbi:MAG: hypothetical protein HOK67_16560 [Deltaproteobacteria bacterium]|jgi:hypothetical protein|nr:hypothetical protein [Deltaproteobacteria bacterium]